MSYEIVKKIRIEKTEDKDTGMKYEGVYITSAANNCTPYYFQEWELATNKRYLEDKILALFEKVLDGYLQLRSTCGKFYKIYKETEDLDHKINRFTKVSIFEFDWKYHTDMYGVKRDWLAQYATDRYFKREPKNFELFLEDYARQLDLEKKQAEKEMQERDEVSIRSASWASIFAKDEDGKALYDVLADHEDNIYLCKRDQYANRGILSNASKAIKFPKRSDLGILYGVLSGNFNAYRRSEILAWYKDRPLTRANYEVQLDAVQELLNSMELPEYDKLPWLDFKTKEVVA